MKSQPNTMSDFDRANLLCNEVKKNFKEVTFYGNNEIVIKENERKCVVRALSLSGYDIRTFEKSPEGTLRVLYQKTFWQAHISSCIALIKKHLLEKQVLPKPKEFHVGIEKSKNWIRRDLSIVEAHFEKIVGIGENLYVDSDIANPKKSSLWFLFHITCIDFSLRIIYHPEKGWYPLTGQKCFKIVNKDTKLFDGDKTLLDEVISEI